MSITLNAAYLQAQFNDATISNTNAEVILDGAINMLNVYGAGLSNLAGVAESKSGSYTSAQVGAVMAVAREIYSQHFKNAEQTNVAVASISLAYSRGDLLAMAQNIAKQLVGVSFDKV